jgi:hypothetical protein
MLFLLRRARRSRPAGGHFLLLAQKKVTKEESLKTHLICGRGGRPTHAAKVVRQGMDRGLAWTNPPNAVLALQPANPWPMNSRIERLACVVCSHVNQPDRIGLFALVTFI